MPWPRGPCVLQVMEMHGYVGLRTQPPARWLFLVSSSTIQLQYSVLERRLQQTQPESCLCHFPALTLEPLFLICREKGQ